MADPAVHERVAKLETVNERTKDEIMELKKSIMDLTTAVNGLTARLDKTQNMFIGAGVVCTAVGGFIVWILGAISKFAVSITH